MISDPSLLPGHSPLPGFSQLADKAQLPDVFPVLGKSLLRRQVSPWVVRGIFGLMFSVGGVLLLDAAGAIRLYPHEAHPERFTGGDSIRQLMTKVQAITPIKEGDQVDLPQVGGWVNGDKAKTVVGGKWVVLDLWALW